MHAAEHQTMRKSGDQTRLTAIWEEESQVTVKPKTRGIGAAVKDWFGQRKARKTEALARQQGSR
jgi:hypothetical protein